MATEISRDNPFDNYAIIGGIVVVIPTGYSTEESAAAPTVPEEGFTPTRVEYAIIGGIAIELPSGHGVEEGHLVPSAVEESDAGYA